MGKFKFTKTGIKDMFVVEPTLLKTKEDTSWKPIMKTTSGMQAMS